MGGFFGVASRRDAILDTFFGTDYHSHLGTSRAGMAGYDPKVGLQREIHNIQNSPFRTKFENITEDMHGTSAMGCISDSDPQPLLIRSGLGTFAICMIGIIRNASELIETYLSHNGHFDAMTGGAVNSTELLASLISTKSDFVSGIRFAQDAIEGTASILILKQDGHLIAARDKLGRLPILVGKNADGYCVTFESFASQKLGYEKETELGPGEIVEISPDGFRQLAPARDKMRICAFLWTYYGYPSSTYEGVNVEAMRYRNGEILAENDRANGHGNTHIDHVSGVPDSGTPHAIGYANRSGIPFARPFIKYTPTWSRSFMPSHQTEREHVAKMKQIPIKELISGKDLLFVDDSIVRGTQLKKTVDFLYESGARSIHMRSACPPIMYGCKYLNFSRATSDTELIARRTILELEGEQGFAHIEEYSDGSTERGKKLRSAICEKLHFASLDFQSIEGAVKAIGLDPCKLCTYCWNGKE